jgi:hypothetical protein
MRTLIIIAAMMCATQAHAATAFLVSCNAQSTVTGSLQWVGVYEYAGQQFTLSFPMSAPSCPVSIQVR